MHAVHDDPAAGAGPQQMPGQLGRPVEHQPAVAEELGPRQHGGVGDVVRRVGRVERGVADQRHRIAGEDRPHRLLGLRRIRRRGPEQSRRQIPVSERQQRSLRTHEAARYPPMMMGTAPQSVAMPEPAEPLRYRLITGPDDVELRALVSPWG